MSDEVADIAKLLAEGQEYYDGEELCIRGLEHLVEEDVADYRAEKMIASIDAVLDEQDEQAEEDIYDPDMIAEIYSEIVNPLLREAYLVGLRDAKEGAAAAAQIPDLEIPTMVHKTPPPPKPPTESPQPEPSQSQIEPQQPPESPVPPIETPQKEEDSKSVEPPQPPPPSPPKVEKPKQEKADEKDFMCDGDQEEAYFDLADIDDDVEGQMKLNTSLSSIGGEVLPEKNVPLPTKKKVSAEKKAQKKEKAASTSGDEKSSRKTLRRKTFNRKGGSELSPFVFRRDGTKQFRNFDAEHMKREEKRVRKDCIQSSMFKFLDDGDDDIEKIISKSPPKNKSKKKMNVLVRPRATTTTIKLKVSKGANVRKKS
jgi:hypothetical protein